MKSLSNLVFFFRMIGSSVIGQIQVWFGLAAPVPKLSDGLMDDTWLFPKPNRSPEEQAQLEQEKSQLEKIWLQQLSEDIQANNEKSKLAIWMLAKHNGDQVLAILQNTLQAGSNQLRYEVIQRIESENMVKAVDMLEFTAVSDSDPEIRQYASEVVEKLRKGRS